MEIIVSLSDIDHLTRLKDSDINGIIYGSLFTNKYNYTLNELVQIDAFCIKNNLKRYISVDAFINESDKNDLYSYFEIIKSLNPDGIYFSDFAVLNCAKGYNLADKLIYDSDTIITNSLDASFYLNQGIGVVLARELCLDEILNILKKFPGQIDMQIFGHQRIAQSKRKFLSNYFKEVNKLVDIKNKDTISIVEESRSYNLPIKESANGTFIYSDFILLIYDELPYLSELIKRGIVDSSFIDSKLLFNVLGDMKRINKDNARFMKDALIDKYKHCTFSEGYFYKKTVDRK